MKIIKLLIILFLVLVVVIVLVGGYLGFIPVVASVFGSDKPKDLGITHSTEDLNSAQTKLQQELVDSSGDPNEQVLLATPNNIETSLSQEEYSAHVEKVHPINDVQIKFDGENFEMSGRINKARIPDFVRTLGFHGSDAEILEIVNTYLPGNPVFYMTGSGNTTNGDVTMNLKKAEIGRLPVPADQAEYYIETYLETVIDRIPSLTAESVTLENGELKYSGTTPSTLPKY